MFLKSPQINQMQALTLMWGSERHDDFWNEHDSTSEDAEKRLPKRQPITSEGNCQANHAPRSCNDVRRATEVEGIICAYETFNGMPFLKHGGGQSSIRFRKKIMF